MQLVLQAKHRHSKVRREEEQDVFLLIPLNCGSEIMLRQFTNQNFIDFSAFERELATADLTSKSTSSESITNASQIWLWFFSLPLRRDTDFLLK